MGKKILITVGLLLSFSFNLLSQSILDIFYDELPSTYQTDKKLRKTENKILEQGYDLDPVLIYYYMEYIYYYHKKIMFMKGKNFKHLYFVKLNEMIREKNDWITELNKLVENDTSLTDILKNSITNELKKLKEKEINENWMETAPRIDKNKQYYYAYKAVTRDRKLKYQSNIDYPALYLKWIHERKKSLLTSFEKADLSEKEKKVLFHEIFNNWFLLKDLPKEKIVQYMVKFITVPQNSSIFLIIGQNFIVLPDFRTYFYFGVNSTISSPSFDDQMTIQSTRTDVEYSFSSRLSINRPIQYVTAGLKFYFLKIFNYNYYINFFMYYSKLDLQIPITMTNFYNYFGNSIEGILVRNHSHWKSNKWYGFAFAMPIYQYKELLNFEIGTSYRHASSEIILDYQYDLSPSGETIITNEKRSMEQTQLYFYYSINLKIYKDFILSVNNTGNYHSISLKFEKRIF